MKGLTKQKSVLTRLNNQMAGLTRFINELTGLTYQRSEIEQSGPYHAVEAGVAVAGAWPASDLSVQEAVLLQIEGPDHEQSED